MYRISNGVRSTHGQDGAIVLDVQQGQMFNLNLVGSKILELLENGSAESDIVSVIVHEFDADLEIVEKDVREFMESLKKHRLIADAQQTDVAWPGSGKMASEEQNGQESYRVIVLRRGTEVLLGWQRDQFELPSVVIPAGNRVAETVTSAIKGDWGEEVVCLFETDTAARRDGTGVRFQATEHWRTSSRPARQTRWLPVAALSQDLGSCEM
jgi:hypothetical protein